jgi:hypothetical protein
MRANRGLRALRGLPGDASNKNAREIPGMMGLLDQAMKKTTAFN